MYHSIYFKDVEHDVTKNTWTDWCLIPSERPVVSQPGVTYKYVDIPGRSGAIDLTTYLTGSPVLNDRSGSFSFYVDNNHPELGTWADRKMAIATFLHSSEEMYMILEDDPEYCYIGRFNMKEWRPGSNNSMVSIEYRVRPLKYPVSNLISNIGGEVNDNLVGTGGVLG